MLVDKQQLYIYTYILDLPNPEKNQWTSELTMLWAQTMDNGRKRWNLLNLLEMSNLDT
jgi:hypothetical protein